MNPFLWIAVGVLFYWLAAAELDRRGRLPDWISVSGPLTTLHTDRGKEFLDRLARRERFWRAWANLGVGVALVVMATAFVFVLLSGLLSLQNPQPSQVTEPRNIVVVPGLNDFLPLSVAPEIVLGLLVGLVVHEGGHGLLCRVEDIEIESMGLAFLTIVPMGAFVEPDEESQAAADRGGRTRMYAAGVTNNFAVTVLALALLFGPVAGSIGLAAGVPVAGSMQDSPGAEAGIEGGDRITAIQGEPVERSQELQGVLANTSDRTVAIEVDGEETVDVERSVYVTSAIEGTGVERRSRITAVDGTPVHTTAELRSELEAADARATLDLRRGNETTQTTIPIGARVTVLPDGALAAAGAESGATLVVTSIDGERVLDHEDLSSAIDAREPGEDVEVVAYDGDERETYAVTLGGEPGDPLLGVTLYTGINGMTIDDLGLEYYPADRYLAILGGGVETDLQPWLTDSHVGKALFAMMLPFAGIVGWRAFPFNFPGFTGDVTGFYEATGPLEPLGWLVFVAANALFWIAWMNFNLALFNCIPAFPLDGGHILRTSTEAIVSRLPFDGSYALTKAVTISIGLLMGLSLVLMVAGPRLLS